MLPNLVPIAIQPELVTTVAALLGKPVDPALAQILALGGSYLLNQHQLQVPALTIAQPTAPIAQACALADAFNFGPVSSSVQDTPYRPPAKLRRRRGQPQRDQVCSRAFEQVPAPLVAHTPMIVPFALPTTSEHIDEVKREVSVEQPPLPSNKVPVDRHNMRTRLSELIKEHFSAKCSLKFMQTHAVITKFVDQCIIDLDFPYYNDGHTHTRMMFVIYVASSAFDTGDIGSIPSQQRRMLCSSDDLYRVAISILLDRVIGIDGVPVKSMYLEDMKKLMSFDEPVIKLVPTREEVRTIISNLVKKYVTSGLDTWTIPQDIIVTTCMAHLNLSDMLPGGFIIYVASKDFLETERPTWHYNTDTAIHCYYNAAILILSDKIMNENGTPIKYMLLCDMMKLTPKGEPRLPSEAVRALVRSRVSALLKMVHCKDAPVPKALIGPLLDELKAQLIVRIGDGSREQFIIFMASTLHDEVWSYPNCNEGIALGLTSEQQLHCYKVAIAIFTKNILSHCSIADMKTAVL